MCLTFYFFLFFMQSETLIDDKLVSLELITIKDYCVQGTLPAELYDNFSNDRVGNDIHAFKAALTEHIRSTLHNEAGLSQELTGVVDIRFSFFNKKMHEYLNSRGK